MSKDSHQKTSSACGGMRTTKKKVRNTEFKLFRLEKKIRGAKCKREKRKGRNEW